MANEEVMDPNNVAVMIIANAGDSRSASMEAIDAARCGDFEKADELLKRSTEMLSKAHDAHTKILFNEAREEAEPLAISMILIHASNHFSISEVARDLAEQIVNVYKEIKNGL